MPTPKVKIILLLIAVALARELVFASDQTNQFGYYAPQITTPPANVNVYSGQRATFGAAASGSPSPTYFWTHNGAQAGSGATLYLGPVYYANRGTYTVTAVNSQGTASASAMLTIMANPQTINYTTVGNKTFGTPPFALGASATSGLPLQYTVSYGPVTISTGGMVTLTGTGPVYIIVSQPGNGDWQPASVGISFSILPGVAGVALGNLQQTYDGSPKAASATTTPPGLGVAFTYNGMAAPPINAGSYAVIATVNNPNYTGSVTGTLVINKATATVALNTSSLNQVYDGASKVVTATTAPSGLATTISYNGQPTAPSKAGSYPVVATVNDPNYTGSVSGTLIVNKATASVVLNTSSLNQVYDGSPKVVTASTTPNGLATTISYNGQPTAPSKAGSYPVVATVNDPNYTGSVSGTLIVNKATASVVLNTSSLNQVYDGSPKVVTASTTPNGLATTVSYNGQSTLPSNAGSYPVVATVNDPNYTGSASGTLIVNKATASVVLNASSLNQVYDGSPKVVTAAATPSALTITISYNGSATPPTAAGTYPVTASVNDPNYYTASSSGTLIVSRVVLSVSGIKAANKMYDGTTSATINASGAMLNGVLPVDAGNVTLVTTGATGTFADQNVGTGKTVNISGLTLSGSAAGNYTLTQPTTTADIIGSSNNRINSQALVGNQFTVTITSAAGTKYILEYKNSLADPLWTPAQMQLGTGGSITLTDSLATSPSRLYRVHIE